ncbi:hypothetical protein HOG48_01695 [Candidatus Peregrinibacteria bacterium]|jgi:vancomycin resistance protein YoaR|nr:hypothetical protein [Candidatus Peregrinibacteria bacterium]
MMRFLKTIFLTLFFATLMMGTVFAAEEGVVDEGMVDAFDMESMYGPLKFVDMPIEFILGEKAFELTFGDFLNEKEKMDEYKIYELAPFIDRQAKDAKVILNDFGNLEIAPEKPGLRVNLGDLKKRLKKVEKDFDFSRIELEYSFVPPHVYVTDLEPVLPRLEEMVNRTLMLQTQPDEMLQTLGDATIQKYSFNLRDNFELLEVEFRSYLNLSGVKMPVSLMKEDKIARLLLKKDWLININEQAIDNYIREELAADLEIPAEDMKILMELPEDLKIDKKGEWLNKANISFEGSAQNGIMVDRKELADRILLMLNGNPNLEESDSVVLIPLKEVKAVIDAPKELQERGITELFAVGYSNFWGSSWKRIHNIKTGLSKFDGLIIPKGSVFSFNQHLGAVDAATGYLEELVILGDETKPEYGGGLCQVSSTFFRAGLFGGLDIAERRAHSYAVSYYAHPGGHGLDCTVYIGGPDCKILNDTPGDLLIQAYADGNDAYFKFYGTTDGRTVSLDGPYYSNHRTAPPDKTIYDPSLPADHVEEKEHPHNGFDAVWHRTIQRPDGTQYTQTFKSSYQARPKVFIRGGQDPEAEMANEL